MGQKEEYEDFATEIYEWISLVRLQSSLINPDGRPDPYLCRYQVPGAVEQHSDAELCKITWKGFLSPEWTRRTLVEVMLALPSESWFTFSASTFATSILADTSDMTMLRPPKSSGEYALWEIKGHD
jgi:ribonuclease P/MRP protein subunit RPP40